MKLPGILSPKNTSNTVSKSYEFTGMPRDISYHQNFMSVSELNQKVRQEILNHN